MSLFRHVHCEYLDPCFGGVDIREPDPDVLCPERDETPAVDAVGRLDIKPITLQARVGIATGLVVEGSAQEQSVVGETPTLAARLQSLAEPGAVVIAAGMRRLVRDLFEIRDLGSVDVKGIAAPMPAWQVLHPSAVTSRFEALRGSALTPLVGRDEEIELPLRC